MPSSKEIVYGEWDIITYVIVKISEETMQEVKSVFRMFLLSKTYDLLSNDASGLWAESCDFVLELYRTELQGNTTKFEKLLISTVL